MHRRGANSGLDLPCLRQRNICVCSNRPDWSRASQVPVFKISQVYAWSDIVIDIAKWIPLCTLDACKFSMGMQAPLLLSSPISIPLPAIVTSMFPLCAAVAGATPLVGRLVATAGAASSLTLGSSVSVESGTTTNTFTATISALSDAFPADSEVLCFLTIRFHDGPASHFAPGHCQLRFECYDSRQLSENHLEHFCQEQQRL